MATTEPPRRDTTTLLIEGMTCGGCASTLTRVLNKVPGVKDAQVDLAGARATVIGTARADELVAAVEAAGFGAAVAGG